jgi:hypothetical protein
MYTNYIKNHQCEKTVLSLLLAQFLPSLSTGKLTEGFPFYITKCKSEMQQSYLYNKTDYDRNKIN